jgi:outer membrane lipoprotein SlyB
MKNILMAAAISLAAIATTVPANAGPDGAVSGAIVGGATGAVIGGPVGLAIGGVTGAIIGDNVTGPPCYTDRYGRTFCR